MTICEYGCGREATAFKPYAKKWCCSKSQNQCPAVKAKQNTPETIAARKAGVRKKYGVDNVSSLGYIKQKKRETCLRNHGVEHPQQSKSVRAKTKAVCLERYGVENPQQYNQVREKTKITSLAKYGAENPSQSKEVKDRIKTAWGGSHPLNDPRIMAKRKITCKERYGFEYATQAPHIRQKLSDYAKIKRMSDTEYQSFMEYCGLVERYSEHSWRSHQSSINPYGLARGAEYHLDHKYSKLAGFKNKVPPEMIGHWCNLELLRASENISKGAKCSITITELYESYEKGAT